jgi:aspartate aminotransferase
MRFASQIKELEISGIRKCFEGAGPGSINLGLGQPDFDTPSHIKDAAIKAIQQGFTGYTPNCGFPDLLIAISQKFERENQLKYSMEEIMVTSGASEALFLAISALIDRGDEVLMGDPSFLSYSALTKAMGGVPIGVPLSDRLTLTPQEVNEKITSRTKAIIVNSPSNPTGSVQSDEELRGIAQIADEKDIAIISDEVYEHLIYDGQHISPAKYSDNVITINAVSKTYAMTGWRLGYLAAKGSALEQMLKVHQYAQACACSISQKAAVAALTGPQDCVSMMRDEFRRRRDMMVQGFLEMGVDLVRPQGAFYLFPKVGDGESASARLAKAGVIAVPGSAFGPGGKEHIRLSYASSRENLEEALRRMKGVF